MSDYRVFLKRGSENVGVDLPDIYKDLDSETYSDQIKTYICSKFNIEYNNVKLDIKRKGKLMKNCKDIEVINSDELQFTEIISSEPKFKGVVMNAGFYDISDKKFSDCNAPIVMNYIEKAIEEYTKHINEIKENIMTFTSTCNNQEILQEISNFLVFRYRESFIDEFPMNFYDGIVYFCKFFNGSPCGFGFMYDPRNKIYYEGNFRDNRIIQGRELKMSGDRYFLVCQAYVNRLPCSLGSVTYIDSVVTFNGWFNNGMYHNNGKLVTHEGVYVGSFINSCRSGYGAMHYNNGDKYYGYWSGDKKNTFGKYLHANGNYYSGIYVNDLEHEYGVFYDRSTNLSYVGIFNNGKRTFKKHEFKICAGHLFYSDFVGSYEIKLIDEDNTFKKSSSTHVFDRDDLYLRHNKIDDVVYGFKHKSRQYIGNFDYEANLYGVGRLFYDDNSLITNNTTTYEEPYSQEFNKRKFNRYREYQCLFSNRNVNGFGVIKYSNGDVYIGDIKNGYKNGTGVYTYANGLIEHSFWICDVKREVK